MNSQDLLKLKMPDSPGVYFFKKKAEILYIGRATSLKDRVKSYFRADLLGARGQLLVDMVESADTIEWQTTDSVLEAIILENNLIKKHWPLFNTKDKDNRSYNYVAITDEEFPRVLIVRGRNLEQDPDAAHAYKKIFGPYPQAGLLREALVIVRRIFPFRDDKAGNMHALHHEAFYRSIGLSPDISSPDAKKTYAKTIRNLTLFFEGRKKDLLKVLNKEMKVYAREKKFEEASRARNTIYALTHIQDVALIKADRYSPVASSGEAPFRIEAYDIAHLGGKEVVGVMTVVEGGEPNKAEYRKFKLSRDVNDDTGNLQEILRRRFGHLEWRLPDLVVIDGGKGQINAAKEVVKDLPIVSVLKDEAHKAKEILTTADVSPALVETHRVAILLANSESHRFAIAYHRGLRRRKSGLNK
jgi:excinuclease ABC subunit C